jgi:hypothetical protein
MSLEADARAVAERAGTLSAKRDRIARRILGAEKARVSAYRDVFMQDGELSPAALIVLDDLSRFGRVGRDMSLSDENLLRRQATVRATIQHILSSFDLDPRRLARLVRQLSDRSTPPSERHSLATGEDT